MSTATATAGRGRGGERAGRGDRRPISDAEAGDLARRAREGDDAARWELAWSAWPLVKYLARRKALASGRPGLGEELAAEALLGLHRRCSTYDAARGRWTVYASYLTWTLLNCAFNRVAFAVTLPPNDPGTEAFARAARPAYPLDPGRDGYDRAEPDGGEPPFGGDEVDRLRAAVASGLTDRQRAVIVARYGLDGGPPRLQREVGERLGLSPTGVRFHELRALGALREHLGATATTTTTTGKGGRAS